MAIEVEMTEDIRKYDVKVIGPFNARQLACTLIGIACAVPGVLIPKSIDGKIIFGIICAAPAMLCGWVKYCGMHFETMFFRFLYLLVLTPKKRLYKRKNSYRAFVDELEKKEEQERVKTMSAKEKKAYLKEKKLKQQIKYSKLPQYKIYR